MVVGRLGTLLTGIVLARLLTPHDFGVYAVALVAFLAATSLNELGVSLAIVRWPGDVSRIAPTVTTIAVCNSTLLFLLALVAAPWFASLLGAPEATDPVRLMSFAVVIDGVTSTPAALLQRQFRQDRRMVADLANQVLGAAVSIALAATGHGAWSLAWGRIAGNSVSAALITLLAPARYWPGFSRRQARSLLAFGVPLAGASLLVFAILNLANVIVGATLGPVALGLYVLAFNLSSWPVNIFSSTARTVSLAGFSRLQGDPQRLARSFTASFGWLMAATVPACLMLAMLAQPLIRFVYGDRWLAAAPALEFLAAVGGFRVALELVYDFLVAGGRTRAVLLLQAAWLSCLLPALVLGARLGGIPGAGAAQVAVLVLVVCPLALWALHGHGIGAAALARQLIRPAAGGSLIALVALAVPAVVHQNDFLLLAVAGSLGLAGYAAITWPVLAAAVSRNRVQPAA
jgi:O-antigen/teichoic acid export membrane protein